MSFDKIKNIRYSVGGNIYKFGNYKVYIIPGEKLRYNISSLIDRILNGTINLSDVCRLETRENVINEKYIRSYLTNPKPDTIFMFVSKTIEKNEKKWHDEVIDTRLITQLESLPIIENDKYFNKLRTQVGLRPIMKMKLNIDPERYRSELLTRMKEIELESRTSHSTSRRHNGGAYKDITLYYENLISFNFLKKTSEKNYYCIITCSTKMFGFDPEHMRTNEYKFPWATFLLYIFIKSMGTKEINMFIEASNLRNIGYHKRFLYNLGDKPCETPDDIYEKSLAIPYSILRPPTTEETQMLDELVKSLPKSYKRQNGYRMKLCNIQNAINIAKLHELEEYLERKWYQTMGTDDIDLTKTQIRQLSSKTLSRARSLSNSNKSRKQSRVAKSI